MRLLNQSFLVLLFAWLSLGNLPGATVGLIKVDGAISPATANYIERAIGIAEERKDACLVVQMDTPGGLLESTKHIVQSFYASSVPVVVFVAPAGAGATSAGCFITLAADIAAMAPNTSIGAAHPVSLGPGGGGEQQTDSVMKEKMANYASSFMQGIAERRGRNVEWAISAVRESASITAEKAIELKVIDLMAEDVPDLLKKLDGKRVRDRSLRTADAKVSNIPMIPREHLFQMLWRPEVLLILMMAAIYGIIGELSNPGAIIPGVIGGISLILVLYMSAILPVNVAGLALIGLAFILFIIDVFSPTHGILTGGGILAFFLGAIMLFNRAGPGFTLSLGYVIPATLLTAGFFVFVAGAGVRAQALPVRAGKETMVGRTVEALTAITSTEGKVFVEGEYWFATSDTPIAKGSAVEIVGIRRLTLLVRPKATATIPAGGD